MAFENCVALTKLILVGINIVVDIFAFSNLTTEQVDLYLSAEEYNTVTGANHNEWESRTWTFKSIKQIP